MFGKKSYRTIPNLKFTLCNVIYAFLCDRCKMTIPVVKTEKSVKEGGERAYGGVKNQAEKPIMRHFNGHTVYDMRFVVLQSLGGESRAYRQFVKETWIIRLKPKTQLGCYVQLKF